MRRRFPAWQRTAGGAGLGLGKQQRGVCVGAHFYFPFFSLVERAYSHVRQWALRSRPYEFVDLTIDVRSAIVSIETAQ